MNQPRPKNTESHNMPKQIKRPKRPTGYLKENSKKVLDVYAAQTKKNATKAYKEVHPEASDITARSNAHQLLKKPTAQIYLQKHISKAKSTIVDLLESDKDDIKLKAADSILDRELGKPIQRQQTQNTNFNFDVQPSQELNDAFTAFLKANTTQT